MTVVAPTQLGVVARYFSLFLVAVSLLGAVISFLTVGDVVLSWAIFIINLIVAAILAWQFYKYRAHTILAYDDRGFRLTVGRQKTERRWRDFSQVSLAHTGGGVFVLRLYEDDTPAVELPLSALKLDPQAFRFEVMGFLGQAPMIDRVQEEGSG